MSLKNETFASCGIQSLSENMSVRHPVLFRTGQIGIIVKKAITDELMHKITQCIVEYLRRASLSCCVIRNQSGDAFQLECAVSFKESRKGQILLQSLRTRCIHKWFAKDNPLGHCVEITLQAVDDNDTSIFERIRAQAASDQWTTLCRKENTKPPQPAATSGLAETGVARVGLGIALPVVADPVARAGLGVDRPAAAAGRAARTRLLSCRLSRATHSFQPAARGVLLTFH